MKVVLLALTAFLFTNIACKKNDAGILFKNGIVRDFGTPALDGCGWVIEVEGAFYSPINLGEKYKKNEQRILVKYKLLDETECGWFGGKGILKLKS